MVPYTRGAEFSRPVAAVVSEAQKLAARGVRLSIAPDGRRWTEKFGEPDDYKTLFRPAPAWNTYRILAYASHVEVWLNGTRVSVLDDHQSGLARHAADLATARALLYSEEPLTLAELARLA